jgi:hypothetical protein
MPDFGNDILSGAFPFSYADWVIAYGLGGVHNAFRNLFDVPTGAITNPPLLSISFNASDNPVIHTPPRFFRLRVTER